MAKARSLGPGGRAGLRAQASPDHPWVTEHPEWFSKRADGSIAYAENPPKKYQDIYTSTSTSTGTASTRVRCGIVRLWMSHGVRIFRVDNPHTKPVNFWAWLLAEVRRTDPDVLFLAEAFTKPAMMHMLGKVGFQQGYTYFTWRNEKWEIEEYMKELTTETDSFFRPNFFVNTPDILPSFLQWGGKTGLHHPGRAGRDPVPDLWGSTPASSCSRTPRSARAGRSTWTRRSSSTGRGTGQAPTASGENLNMLLGRLNQIRTRAPGPAAAAQPAPSTTPRTASADRLLQAQRATTR